VTPESPVEDYLDRLLVASPGGPREVRSLLAEAEAHLWDATAAGVARGLTQEEAQRQAVGRFGTVHSVAAAESRRQALPLTTLVRQIVLSALFLGGVGGVAVGVSGIITWLLGSLGGSTFIVNISSHTFLPPSDCARWLAGDPATHSCYQAALADWRGDVVLFRLVAGVLGLLALAAYFLMRRRRWFTTLPATVVDTIAVTLFSASGLFLLGLGVDWLVQHDNGAGQWLGAAPVALALALYFGLRLVGDIRHPREPRPV
jgi:hypothetical protein